MSDLAPPLEKLFLGQLGAHVVTPSPFPGQGLALDPLGYVPVRAQVTPLAIITRTGDQTISGATETTVDYTSTLIDNANMTDLANDRIWIREPGIYLARVRLDLSTGSPVDRITRIKKNGTSISRGEEFCAVVLEGVEGDFLTVTAYAASGVAPYGVHVEEESPQFSVVKIGEPSRKSGVPSA